jgi:hypothetical protein
MLASPEVYKQADALKITHGVKQLMKSLLSLLTDLRLAADEQES